jgi:hypothetical protein
LTEGEKTVKKALIAAALLFGCIGQALAVGSIADVTVYDRAENRTLPVHYHEGRYYVVGKPGNEYQVNIRNNQSGEILTVISVDGVNAVSGATANWGQTGYVLSPYTSFGIKGWRKSTQRVAAFFFTELDNSYAVRTGRPDNIGVIGVAVFRKKPESAVSINRDFHQRREAPASGAPVGDVESAAKESLRAADAAPPVVPQPVLPEKSLGTGHGKSETSVVRYTNSERAASTPDEVITIYYDSYRNLAAQGVTRDSERIARPSPFPGQFVPDPR